MPILRRLIPVFLFVSLAFSQTSPYPSALDTTTTLTDLADRAQTTLSASMTSSATSFTVVSGSKFSAHMIVTIDNEQIKIWSVSGNTVHVGDTGIDNLNGRGYGGTSAASHASAALVSDYFVSWQFKALRNSIIAIETTLGINLANIPTPTNPLPINQGGTNAQTASAARTSLGVAALGANSDITSLSALSTPLTVAQGGTGVATLTGIPVGSGTTAFSPVAAASPRQVLRRKPNVSALTYEFADPVLYASVDYDFPAQTPGGSLSAGSNTITMTPCPLGVNGADTAHYLYISAGTGTAEAVLMTGGTCTSGATTGTVIVTCANTHSSTWTIGSATGGIQEAVVTVAAAGGGKVVASSATLRGPVHPPYANTVWIEGSGRSATILTVGSNFPTTVSGVFDFSPAQVTATNADSGGVRGLTISFTQPDSTNVGTYTHWPPAVYMSGNNHVTVENVIIEKAWDGITSPLSNGIIVRNVGISFFHRGVTVDVAFDTVEITGLEGWVFGLTSNQTTAFKAVGTANYLLDLAGCDLVYLTDVISISGKFATLYKNGSSVVPVVVGTNIRMDTNGGWEQSNGYVDLSNVQASTIAGTQAFSVSGGALHIQGLDIQNNGATSAAISYNPSQANTGFAAGFQAGVFVTGLSVASTAEDAYIIYATTSGAFAGTGTVMVNGGNIARSGGVSYVNPLFVEQAGTGTIVMDISHVKITSNSATAASAFNFASSNAHSVSFVDAPGGWTYTIPTTTRWFNNSGLTSNYNLIPLATKTSGTVSMSTLIALIGPNYIASETGANNAIAGALTDAAGTNVPQAAGLKVTILLAHSLQAGANTFALNGATAVAIKSSRNPANNIGTAYVSGGTVTLQYDGTRYVDISQ